LNNEHIPLSDKIYPVFIARCYAERGVATASRLSVSAFVRDVEVP